MADENNKWPCTSCDAIFDTRNALRNHKSSSHPAAPKKPPTIKCDVCSDLFGTVRTLNRHREKEHPNRLASAFSKAKGNKTCGHCKNSFPNQLVLCQHLSEIHKEKVEIKTKTCASKADFHDFMESLTEKSQCDFHVSYSNQKVAGYLCSRSGSYETKDSKTAKRAPKNIATIKTGYCCSAFAKAKFLDNGKVEVVYCNDHYKHKIDLLVQKENKEALKNCFEKLYERAGDIHAKLFMSDCAEQYWNAWSEVFTVTETHHLWCSWHVLRAWRKVLRQKIKLSDEHATIHAMEMTLMKYTDETIFRVEASKFLTHLEQMEELHPGQGFEAYAEYFRDEWLRSDEIIKLWAYWARLNCHINTNMLCEAFHKTFKVHWLRLRLLLEYRLMLRLRFPHLLELRLMLGFIAAIGLCGEMSTWVFGGDCLPGES